MPKNQSSKVSEFQSNKEAKFQSARVQMGTEIILKEQMIVNDSYQHFFIVPKNQSTKVPEYNWEQRLF